MPKMSGVTIYIEAILTTVIVLQPSQNILINREGQLTVGVG